MAEMWIEKETEHVNDLIYLAWHTAAFERQKKLPELKPLLRKNIQHKKQTDEEMLAKVKILNTAFGGEVING